MLKWFEEQDNDISHDPPIHQISMLFGICGSNREAKAIESVSNNFKVQLKLNNKYMHLN